MVCDCDLKNLVEGRDSALACLRELAPPPSWIHDSGFGLRAGWELKEPLTTDEDMRRAEVVMQRLAVLLAGDPAPTNRASLYRVPGSHNTKEGGKRPCQVIEACGAGYDITELEDMLDLYGHPLLHYAPGKGPKSNGHATNGQAFDFTAPLSSDGPIDVEARLAAMRFQGVGDSAIHTTQLQVTASLTGAGRPVTETVARVLAATAAAVDGDPRCANWDWREEELAIARMCYDLINKEMRNGRDLSHCLPDHLYDTWRAVLDKDAHPTVARNAAGWHVRGYTNTNNGNGATAPPQQKAGSRIALQRFERFEEKTLPRREWVLAGHYMLGTLTGTVAPGGAGKSNLSLVESISIALGRDLIYGQQIKRYRTWYHNAEDALVEIKRRVAAICKHYQIDMRELEGWLFLTSGLDMPIKIATGNGELKIEKETIRQIVEVIEGDEIEVATFDPLIAMHTTGESDNVKMRQVCDEFARVANVTKCGIEVVHHVRKRQPGQEEHTTADSRGASAVIDAVRSARVLNQMSKTEAGNMEIDDLDRLNYVRLDRGKANMSRIGLICWLKFETVRLDNGDEEAGEPGDDVGVMTRWDPPDLRIVLSDADRKHFQTVIAANPEWRADNRADKWVGHLIAHRFGLDADSPPDRRRIMATWRQLVQEGTLAVEERLDDKRRARDFVVPGRRK